MRSLGVLNDRILYQKTLPEKFSPCSIHVWELGHQCGSESGTVIRYSHHRNIGVYCERGHRRAQFEWVPHEEFLTGGRFAHASVPPEYLSASVTQRRSTEYRPNEAARKNAHDAKACFLCKAPPLHTREPERVIRWLQRYDRPLYNRVRTELGNAADLPDSLFQWPNLISEPLRNEVNDRVENSKLHADHLVPVELLKLGKGRLDKKAFSYAAKRMIIPLCESCNRGRSYTLEAFATLEERYCGYFFQSNEELMKESEAYLWFVQAYSVCSEAAAVAKSRRAETR